MPVTRYAKSGDVHIAYQVFGNGAIDLVFVPGFISHIENYWEHPDLARWLLRLGSFARVVMFDKRGTGLSDPVPEMPSLDQRMDDVRAVMDAAGTENAALFGISEGGALSALFAATYPQRCQRLILYGAFARFPLGYGDVLEPFSVCRSGLGKRAQSAIMGAIASERSDDAAMVGPLRTIGREPRCGHGSRCGWSAETDVSAILPSIRVPTLVIHCKDDTLIPVDCGRFIASNIPGARLIELPGKDHLFFIHEQIGDCIEEFLTGSVSRGRSYRVLATVLFTRHCGSTSRAAGSVDERWRDLLECSSRHRPTRTCSFRGSEVGRWETAFSPPSTGPPAPCGVRARSPRLSDLSTLKSAAACIPARSRSKGRTCRVSRSTLPRGSPRRRGRRDSGIANGEGPGRGVRPALQRPRKTSPRASRTDGTLRGLDRCWPNDWPRYVPEPTSTAPEERVSGWRRQL